MGDANPIRTLRDYSKPSHKGYRNTIELPEGNNVKDRKTPQRYLDVPTTSRSISLKSMDSFQCKIDHVSGGKLRDKNADESWKIIENLALYDHERWNDSKDFVKSVKAISISQGTSKTPDRRILELEDQINFLLKGPRPTSRPSSTHVPNCDDEVFVFGLAAAVSKHKEGLVLFNFDHEWIRIINVHIVHNDYLLDYHDIDMLWMFALNKYEDRIAQYDRYSKLSGARSGGLSRLWISLTCDVNGVERPVLTQMAHLVVNITFASTSIGSTSFLPSVLLMTIVGVAVVVVVAGAVVESSSVVKLSFVSQGQYMSSKAFLTSPGDLIGLLLSPLAFGHMHSQDKASSSSRTGVPVGITSTSLYSLCLDAEGEHFQLNFYCLLES
ncbi:hypothetical protein Tco_0400683 [Tanacetum coccineum]